MKNRSKFFLFLIFILSLSIMNEVYAYENKFNNIKDITTLNTNDLNLPNSYDLRNVNEINYLTPTKDQKNYNLCWAFSSTSAFESVLKKSGYVSNDFNKWYSPYQVDALITNPTYKNYNVYKISSEWENNDHKKGEGYYESEAYKSFTTAFSPVLEENFDENLYKTGTYNINDIYNTSNSEYFVTDFDRLTDIKNLSIDKVIKYYILNYGAVTFATTSPSYYCSDSKPKKECYLRKIAVDDYRGLHAMNIVGWDDTNKYWIIQNSWGANKWAYMYMPYGSWILRAYGIKNISRVNFDNRYYSYKSNNNQFTFNKFAENEIIDSITVDISNQDDYEVYLDNNETSDTNFEKIGEFKSAFTGRKSLDLSNKNIVLNNDKYSIYIAGKNGSKIEGIAVYTKDEIKTEKKSYLYNIEDIVDLEQKLALKTRLKNIPSNELVYKFFDKSGNDITDKFTYDQSYYYSFEDTNQAEFNLDTSLFYSLDKEFRVEIYYQNQKIMNDTFNISTKYSDYFNKGRGTLDEPFIITEANQFEVFADRDISTASEKSYELASDIDFSSIIYTPIKEFSGTFNGNGYSIIGLNRYNVNSENGKNAVGLFQYVTNGIIKNIRLVDCNITLTSEFDYSDIGLVAGDANNSEFSNIYIEGGAIANYSNNSIRHYIGTIVGIVNNTTLENVYSSANLDIDTTSYGEYGGIVGCVTRDKSNLMMNSIQYDGNIISSNDSNYIGGIIGYSGSNKMIELNNIYFSGTITSDNPLNNFGYIYDEIKNIDMKNIVYNDYYNYNYYNIKENENENKDKIFSLIQNNKTEKDGVINININDSNFKQLETYNLEWNKIWYMSDEGPKLQFVRDSKPKVDIIGESDIYVINYEDKTLRNVKLKGNNDTLTKSEFLEKFKSFEGNIYKSDGVTLLNDNDTITTNTIIKINNQIWKIILQGDINGDGIVSVKDVTYLRRYLTSRNNYLNKNQLLAADLDENGETNVSDIDYLIKVIVGGYKEICIWEEGC